MGRRNYFDEKSNEEHESMNIWTVVGFVILFGSLMMAILVKAI